MNYADLEVVVDARQIPLEGDPRVCVESWLRDTWGMEAEVSNMTIEGGWGYREALTFNARVAIPDTEGTA